MSIFDSIFSNSNPEVSGFPWIPLQEIAKLDEFQQSKDTTVLIFKHSTRCGISRSVLSRFEKKHQNNTTRIEFYYLDLLNFRSISKEIAERFNVQHQSPQLLVLKEGEVTFHASHYDILEVDI